MPKECNNNDFEFEEILTKSYFLIQKDLKKIGQGIKFVKKVTVIIKISIKKIKFATSR